MKTLTCPGFRYVSRKWHAQTHLRLPSLKALALSTEASTVHRGSAFEERSMNVLQNDLSMSLKRVGGKDDGGIDFFGWWWLPHESPNAPLHSSLLQRRRRIRVIGQCKAEKKKVGPQYVRELEGVLYRFLTQKSDQDPFFLDDDMKTHSHDQKNFTLPQTSTPTIAVLVSQSAFTKSTILRANSSPIAFCLLHLPPMEQTSPENAIEPSSEISGNLGSVWCNPALCGANGLLKGRMEVRLERHSENASARPALWWDGIRLPSWVPDLSSVTSSGIGVERSGDLR